MREANKEATGPMLETTLLTPTRGALKTTLRTVALLLSAAALMCVLVACGGSGDGSSSEGAQAGPTAGSQKGSQTGSQTPSQGTSKSPAVSDSRCLDEYGNPTLFAITELTGPDLVALLDTGIRMRSGASSWRTWSPPSSTSRSWTNA